MIRLAFLLAALPAFSGLQPYAGSVDTIFDARGSRVTLVTGADAPGVARGAPDLVLHDDDGTPVRVYSDRPITIAEARADLRHCRDARSRAAAIRRRLTARGL